MVVPMLLVVAFLCALVSTDAQQQQWPNWVPGEVKELMNDLDGAYAEVGTAGEKDLHTAEACRIRKDVLKHMSLVAEPQSGQLRAMILQDLGWCDMGKGDYASAFRRFDSAVSELNVPNEDVLMNNVGSASYALLKQASKALKDHKIGEAGVALRRTRSVALRLWDQILKQVMKQNKIPKDGLAQVMPQLMKDKSITTTAGLRLAVDKQLEIIDQQLVKTKDEKDRKSRLIGVAGGSLAYLPGLPMAPTVTAAATPWLEELAKDADKFASEADTAELSKHASLLKRTKPGADCEKLPTLCKALQGSTDVATNTFGESRLMVLKADKKQKLDLCETNGNIGALIALKADLVLSINGKKHPLKQGEAIVFDLCLEASVTSAAEAYAVLIQAWHPEVAASERTYYIREKSSTWKLDDAQVKTVTKAVNDAAKKPWDAAVKAWRGGSSLAADIAESINAEETKKREEKQAAEEAQEKEFQDKDENRKNALEDLEAARIAKKEAAEAKLADKRKRQEEANQILFEREPWRLDSRVVAAKEKLLAAQDERRDANNKMEFDESTRLTKEVSKLERKYNDLMEKGQKYYKKHGKVKGSGGKAEKAEKAEKADADKPAKAEKAEKADADTPAKTEKAEKTSSKEASTDVQARIEELTKQKKKAAADDDFAEAGRLKKEIEALQASGGGSKGAKEDLSAKLAELEAQKAEAAEKEDFKTASKLKKEIAALKAKMEL